VLLGRQAKEAKTPTLEERRTSVAHRLTSEQWPEQPFVITAVDADTGDVVLLDRHAGVGLVDAVTASCAIPCLWPPVELLGRTLIDGGARSPSHLELASGHELVVVLSPIIAAASAGLEREAEQLRAEGSRVIIIAVDDEAFQAMGMNALDPTRRNPAAQHGRRQGLSFDSALLH
jgi:NTE family protein